MRIRLREPAGQVTLNLPESTTVNDLQACITEKTNLFSFDLKYGYPPKPLLLESFESTSPLSEIGIDLDGEQLIVSRSYGQEQLPILAAEQQPLKRSLSINTAESSESSNVPAPSSFSFANFGTSPPLAPKPSKPLSLSHSGEGRNNDAPEISLPDHASTLILRIMPDDNSCLFRAFNTAFFGAMDNMMELRSIIAQVIQTNQDKYSAVVLEKSPDDYCRWIQTEAAWGGAIELDILSRHFDIEICSIGKTQ